VGGGNRGIALLILVNATAAANFPPGKETPHRLYRQHGGSHTHSGRAWRRHNHLPPQGSDSGPGKFHPRTDHEDPEGE
jgi:hypothetical protein